MAFLEWRKFRFFDLKSNIDNGKLSELFQGNRNIHATSSGNNHIVLGDNLGQVHLIKRTWTAQTFRAYELSTDFLCQLKTSSLLITIGHDELGVNPLIKVWDTSRLDKNGIPHCFRISRTLPGNRPVQVSALCVHENSQLMAVGFIDGSLLLYRGDITRERSSKQILLRDSSSAVTGLAFKSSSNIHLFVATASSVLVYNVTQKDKQEKINLDNIGCAKKCCVLAESIQESHFMVGRTDAVYCYTTDGRGPCYAIDGEKVMLEWFRSYLIIISKINRTNANGTSDNSENCITVLDIHNKCIVFSANLKEIKSVFNEFGGFYIIAEQNQVYHLDEKDIQSKLSMLFKKNLYDIAIRIAKSQQYDSEGLVDIFKQYGDHLCNKGDFTGAVEQYIKTIGKLEPSYVIRKFLDSQHIEKLIYYLQALHKARQADKDHTTLLLNCYTKLSNTSGQNNGLKEFIMSKDGYFAYDVDVAIKVCRYGSPDEALMLAKKYQKHDWYIKILIEDQEKYAQVIEYISSLEFEDADFYMKKYGSVLIEKVPDESTQFLKKLCTNFTENPSENALNFNSIRRAEPEDFIHLFLNNSERLVEFLKYVVEEGCLLTTPVYNTLLEHYLHIWTKSNDKTQWSLRILEILQNPDVKYDTSQALVICHMHAFSEGILYLYEEQKLYQQILRHHIAKNDGSAILACCRRFGLQEPSLWVQAMWSVIRDTRNPPRELLSEILTVIAKERLLSPQLVIDALSSESTDITLGHVRTYILQELERESRKHSEVTDLIENYNKDTDKLRKQLDSLKNGAVVIQGSRCAACHHPLELPTVHFLCQHSYHKHCFQSFTDEGQQCPACQPENKTLLDVLKAREDYKDLNETFHSQLENSHDGYSVAAEYFGRGVFNRYKDITNKAVKKLIEHKTVDVEQSRTLIPVREKEIIDYSNYGYGAEAKLRINERKVTTTQKIDEFERKKEAVNPFETDYDPSNNPFENEEPDVDDSNPFKNDCDKNLNPFE